MKNENIIRCHSNEIILAKKIVKWNINKIYKLSPKKASDTKIELLMQVYPALGIFIVTYIFYYRDVYPRLRNRKSGGNNLFSRPYN